LSIKCKGILKFSYDLYAGSCTWRETTDSDMIVECGKLDAKGKIRHGILKEIGLQKEKEETRGATMKWVDAEQEMLKGKILQINSFEYRIRNGCLEYEQDGKWVYSDSSYNCLQRQDWIEAKHKTLSEKQREMPICGERLAYLKSDVKTFIKKILEFEPKMNHNAIGTLEFIYGEPKKQYRDFICKEAGQGLVE